jgi:hypothetical protein
MQRSAQWCECAVVNVEAAHLDTVSCPSELRSSTVQQRRHAVRCQYQPPLRLRRSAAAAAAAEEHLLFCSTSAPARQSSFQPSLGDEDGRGGRTGTSLTGPRVLYDALSRQLHGHGGGWTRLGSHGTQAIAWPMAYDAPCGAVSGTRYVSMRGLLGSRRVPSTYRADPPARVSRRWFECRPIQVHGGSAAYTM